MLPLIAVCNDIITRANEEKIRLSPMKLQKMLYFAYGHYLAEHNELLFEQNFEKWKYGPVVRDAYNLFSVYGSDHITRLARDTNERAIIPNKSCESNKDYFRIMKFVWDKYKACSAEFLSAITHAEGSPWSQTYGLNSVISPELIKSYFKGAEISV